MPHLLYARYVARHKFFVFLAGVRLGPPAGWPVLRYLRWWLHLLVHDLSKLRPSEWGPYVDYFYGPPVGGCEKCKRDRKEAFDVAWLHHQHRNLHHWQRWLLRLDKPEGTWNIGVEDRDRMCLLSDRMDGIRRHYLFSVFRDGHEIVSILNSHPRALRMPERYAREMVADWMGAGRTITGKWEARDWYVQNMDNMVLHPDTRAYVEYVLGLARLLNAATSRGYEFRYAMPGR